MAFSKYAYQAQSPIANIISDITALCTGSATLVSDLSVSCNQTNSTYIKTILPGWVVGSATGLYDATSQYGMAGTTFNKDLLFVGGSINKWYACGSGGISSSPDRITWTTVYSATTITSLAFNGTTIVGVNFTASGTITPIKSLDGTNFSNAATSLSVVASSINNSIVALGTNFYVNGYNGSTPILCYSSPDGNTWTAQYPIGAPVGVCQEVDSTVSLVFTKTGDRAIISGVFNLFGTVLYRSQSHPFPTVYSNIGSVGSYNRMAAGPDYIMLCNNTSQPYYYQIQCSNPTAACSNSSNTIGILVGTDTCYTYNTTLTIPPIKRTIPSGNYTTCCTTTISTTYLAIGTNVCARSTDSGFTWTNITIPVGSYKNSRLINTASTTIVAVGTNVCARSTDNGSTWASSSIPTGDYLAVAGILTTGVTVALGTSGVSARSTDSGATWLAMTSLPETITHLTYTLSGSLGFLALGISGTLYKSVDGTNGSWVVTPMLTSCYSTNFAVSGSTCYMIGGIDSYLTVFKSVDSGVSWTIQSQVAPINPYIGSGAVQSNIAASSTNLMVLYNGTSLYVNTITDTGWKQLIPQFTIGPSSSIVSINGDFIMRDSSTGFIWQTNDNGVNWVRILVDSGTVSGLTTNNSSSLMCWTTTPKSYTITKNLSSVALSAVNTDTVTYKKLIIQISPYTNVTSGSLFLKTFESISGVVQTNSVSQSTSITSCQRIDIANGGIVFMGMSKYYLGMLSYLPATTTWGSSTGLGASIVCEYSRADSWSTSTSGYPTHLYLNSSDLSTGYIPRIRSDNANDSLNFNSSLSIGFTNNKQALDASNLPIQAVSDIYNSSNSSTTLFVGGTLLGGLKRSTDGFGTSTDEITISGNNYFIMAAGTQRLAIPKS